MHVPYVLVLLKGKYVFLQLVRRENSNTGIVVTLLSNKPFH